MHIKARGLVLREVNYKEADKILTVLTDEGGKRTVKARGCRRRGSRLAASAQLLTYSEMTLFEYRDHCTMNEAASLEQFWGVRSDVEKLALGSYFAETMEAVALEGRSDPELLSLILNALYALDKLDRPPALVKAAYELQLLCLAGYAPMLDACAVCGAPEPVDPVLSLTGGVLRCGRCGPGTGGAVPLNAGALAALRHVVNGDSRRIFSFRLGSGGLARMGRACESFLLTQLERGFRTLDFYHNLTAQAPAGGAEAAANPDRRD